MKVDTDTFYVVANIGGGYSRPTFAKDIGTGITDAWGSCDTAERFDTRKEADAFIRKHFHDNRIQYKPMRVRIDVKLYNHAVTAQQKWVTCQAVADATSFGSPLNPKRKSCFPVRVAARR